MPLLSPPVDPRVELPAFGSLPVTSELDEVTTRVIAPNPSPMTLDGTNTHLVGVPGSGVVMIVDPGPEDPAHLERVQQALEDRDAQVAGIAVTHHHLDHAAAARAWGAHFGAAVFAPTREVAGHDGILIGEGDQLGPPEARLEAVATPGHCADHIAFRLATGALLVGDHVLGRGTSVVAHPDGDLLAYLDSLAKVRQLGPDALFPGHGPAVTQDASAVLDYYIAHREYRQQQVLAALEAGPATPRQIVEAVYADHDRHLWPAAESSTRAALVKLAADGLVHYRESSNDPVASLVADRAQGAATAADQS